MRLFRRRERPGQVRRADSADVTHLTTVARGHTGVEAFVEPPTAVSTTTVVFVANTGEWTRRRVADARAAHELANRLGIPWAHVDIAGPAFHPAAARGTTPTGGTGVGVGTLLALVESTTT